MVNGEWSMVNGQWSMVNGQWSISNYEIFKVMIKNYFKTAWRNLQHNKIFSLINVTGLSIGISASLVIFLIVHYDFSFDKFEKDGGRIYRVVSDYTFSGHLFIVPECQMQCPWLLKMKLQVLT
jgi:hypothetical protein